MDDKLTMQLLKWYHEYKQDAPEMMIIVGDYFKELQEYDQAVAIYIELLNLGCDKRLVLMDKLELIKDTSSPHQSLIFYDELRYPGLCELSKKFMTTAEFLYFENVGKDIDFAPIMLEYCKVVECELRQFLIKKKYIRPDEFRSLGQVKNMLEHKIYNKGFIEVLQIIVKYRNCSAHESIITQNKVEEMREILIGPQDWLKKILHL
ncbi:MAG: hypothetical protein BEN18_05045 [Epulopiscium sp. Nuni2H_MBin001]|nr:MAG: hypothetical protein BEN18_05045 [Epulopiscium sp. Nuni2H_MBin001]